MESDPLPSAGPTVNLSLLLLKALEFQAPDNWVSWSFIVAIAVICLGASAFVSGSEIAFFGLTKSDVEDLEEQETPRADTVVELVSKSRRLLATILVINNLVNVTMVVLLSFAINQTIIFHSDMANFLLQTVFLTFLLLLFGEIFPKLIARGRTLQWVLRVAPIMKGIEKVLTPVTSVMVHSSTLIDKLVTKRNEQISTDQLERALEISDVREGKDKEMLEGILSFGEKEVSDIMIARVDVTDIEYHASFQEVVDVIIKSGYSRIPVYDTSQDSIRGILYGKDLLPYIGKSGDSFRWQSLIKEPYFVPESRMIDDLLEDFRKKKIHIAIVIDEYGGTQGIVTLEDIIEEIVGDIDDEYDEADSRYKKIDDDTFIFEGKIPLVDFCRIADLDEETFSEYGEAETLAGLVLEIKGDFPRKNESLQVGPCRFLVMDIVKHRITNVRVHIFRDQEKEENK